MEKISKEDELKVLAEVPTVIRKLASERDYYREKLAARERRDRVEKVASAMIDKGLRNGSVQEVADDLEKEVTAGQLDLDVTEKAVNMVGPDMGKIASVSDSVHSGGGTELEGYIMS